MSLSCVQVHGCDESISEEWEPSSLPDGAHLVNIQRGDKGFGVVLVEQKVHNYVYFLPMQVNKFSRDVAIHHYLFIMLL